MGTVKAIADALTNKAEEIGSALSSYIETGRARPSTLKKVRIKFDHIVEIKNQLSKEFGSMVKSGTKIAFDEVAKSLSKEEKREEKQSAKGKAPEVKAPAPIPEIEVSINNVFY